MKTAVLDYFDELGRAFGQGWSQFWFTPRGPLPLARIRILAGAIAFFTLATYGLDLHRLLGPDGMLPVSTMHELYLSSWSYLDYVSSSQLPAVHVVGLALVGLFMLGVRTRLTSISTVIILLSYFHRAPVLTGQAEAILSVLLLYLCIGRSGDRWSVERFLRSRTGYPPPEPQASATNTIALRLLQIHVAIIHLMMGYSQLAGGEGVWWTGEGIWLLVDPTGGPIVDFRWLAQHPRLVSGWSHLITLYLLTLPIFIWMRLTRPLVLAVGMVVWISLALVTGWLMFYLSMMVALLSYVGGGGLTKQNHQQNSQEDDQGNGEP